MRFNALALLATGSKAWTLSFGNFLAADAVIMPILAPMSIKTPSLGNKFKK